MKKDYKMESIKNYLLKELTNLVPGCRIEEIQKVTPAESIQIKITKNPENKILLKIKTDKKVENQLTLNFFIEKDNRCDIGLEKKIELDEKIKNNLIKNITDISKKHQFLPSKDFPKLKSRKQVNLKE